MRVVHEKDGQSDFKNVACGSRGKLCPQMEGIPCRHPETELICVGYTIKNFGLSVGSSIDSKRANGASANLP